MMHRMNAVRNAANAYYVIRNKLFGSFDKHESNLDSGTFEMDWDLYKGDAPSDDTKEKFHL